MSHSKGPIVGADHSSGLDSPGIEVSGAVAAQRVTASLPGLRRSAAKHGFVHECRRRCVLEDGGVPIFSWLP